MILVNRAPWTNWHSVFMALADKPFPHRVVKPTDMVRRMQQCSQRLMPLLRARLSHPTSPLIEPKSSPTTGEATTCFVSHGTLGIVDLGASQTVIGEHQVSELTAQLPGHVQVQEVPCRTIFRFGNSSTVECNRALLVPLGPYKVKICVVPSRTPFLLSNNVFRKLDASIHTATDSVYFGKLGFGLPLTLSEKKLYLLDFAQLISRAHQTPVKQIETKEETILQSSDSRIGFGSSRTSCPRSGDSEHEGRDADEPPLRLSCPMTVKCDHKTRPTPVFAMASMSKTPTLADRFKALHSRQEFPPIRRPCRWKSWLRPRSHLAKPRRVRPVSKSLRTVAMSHGSWDITRIPPSRYTKPS